MISPIEVLCPDFSCRAAPFGVNFSRSMASITRWRVSARILPLRPLMTFETVLADTPASFATS